MVDFNEQYAVKRAEKTGEKGGCNDYCTYRTPADS